MHQTFELRAADEVAGSLRWERASLARAELADGQWTFKRTGFWHPRITVRLPGSETDLALFTPTWSGGGSLEMGGKRFAFRPANFWHSRWSWTDAGDEPLVHFSSRQGLLKTEGQVSLEPESESLPELSLLVTLGWYLLVMAAKDSAAVAATTATMVATTS
jgi:hypothetical protein